MHLSAVRRPVSPISLLAASLSLVLCAGALTSARAQGKTKSPGVRSAVVASPQTTAFTYQGRLNDSSSAANGSYDFQFALYDALTGGALQGSPNTVTVSGITVTDGVFTVQLDFGASAFPGADRYLEISVKKPADSSYTTLSPRQQITSTPYAVRSISAGSADAVGGQAAADVASATSAANAATSGNTAGAIVKRDGSGDFSAGTITATLSGNASTATTATTANAVSASAGDSVVAAVNAGSSSINTSHVAGDVELAPSAQQTSSATNHLVNLKLVGARTLGTPGQDALLSLSASGHYNDGNDYDSERFRVDNDGGLLAEGQYNSGCCGNIAKEGAGTRFLWYPGKAAIRAGGISGTQWDDANIGLYSTAFGENVRALGDNALAIGKASVAAGSRTVAIGEGNTATGYASVALGYGASTSTSAGSPRNGTFVFSDFSQTLTYLSSGSVDSSTQFHPTVTNSFNVRAVNGSFFYTNTALTTGLVFNSNTATMTLNNSKLTMASDGSTTLTSNSGGSAGVTLSAGGGSWNSLSDRNMKANFAAVNPREILRGVLALPISEWNYKTQDATVRHIGPMAQDFFATFKVGEDNRHISTIDPDGVALAAIQGLNEELKDRDAKIGAQEKQLQAQQQRVSDLEGQVRRQQEVLNGLKRLVCTQNPNAEICK